MLPALRRLIQWGSKLLMLNGTPQGIGLGFALGLSLSLFPIPFAGMIAALALAPVLRANPAATYLGTAVVNPFTAPALYFAELWVGAAVFGRGIPGWDALMAFDAWGWWGLFTDLLGPFGLGAGVMMGVAFAVSYPSVRWIVGRWGAATGAGTGTDAGTGTGTGTEDAARPTDIFGSD
jgi:uncharacterized protein (DUF2062 family)